MLVILTALYGGSTLHIRLGIRVHGTADESLPSL
jgi:hypothetical protein